MNKDGKDKNEKEWNKYSQNSCYQVIVKAIEDNIEKAKRNDKNIADIAFKSFFYIKKVNEDDKDY
jgi:hypothetical protein